MGKKTQTRSYTQYTLKVLFSLSMNQCAHPDCSQSLISEKTDKSDHAVIGEIAHIYAFSEDGPRGKGSLSDEEINRPDNLILLCPTHHRIVDSQHEDYPAELLLEWKRTRERNFQESKKNIMSDIGYSELEVAAKSLMASFNSSSSKESYDTISPIKKIQKNNLGYTSKLFIQMGASNSHLVEEMLSNAIQLSPNFADSLKLGFKTKYNEFIESGLTGDDLFNALNNWAAGSSNDSIRNLAGQCILAHLFIICDIFEK